MKEEATNKLQLENGVLLGENLEYEERYKLSKDEVRTVFCGEVKSIFCHCAVIDCDIKGCGDRFDVERNDFKGWISIGCVDFDREEVAQVKKWLGE